MSGARVKGLLMGRYSLQETIFLTFRPNFKKWSNFTIFQKNLAKNGWCQGLRPDGELIGDWPETITGRWTGGGGEEAAIGRGQAQSSEK